MKTLATIILGIALFSSITSVQARGVRGYAHNYSSLGRTSGYVYRNPYAAYPSVNVRSYIKTDGAYVASHSRTPANWTVQDNLNYRGYGTVRVPRY